MNSKSLKSQALISTLLVIGITGWQLYNYSHNLTQNKDALELWLGGILFGELISWIITHPRPGEVKPSRTGLLLASEIFIILAIGASFTRSAAAGLALGMAMPFLNAGLGRSVTGSRNIVIIVALIGLLGEKNTWFLPIAIVVYYALHLTLNLNSVNNYKNRNVISARKLK